MMTITVILQNKSKKLHAIKFTSNIMCENRENKQRSTKIQSKRNNKHVITHVMIYCKQAAAINKVPKDKAQ